MVDDKRLFILTGQFKNISRAARAMRISPSTASRQLARLQGKFGVRFFKRNGRAIELTARGQSYFEEIQPHLSQIDSIEEKYRRNPNTIVLAASYRPSKYVLPPLLAMFLKKHPKATIDLRTHSSAQIEKLLLEGKVDLAMTTNPTLSRSEFVTEPYSPEPLLPFVAADHPLAQAPSFHASKVGIIPVVLKPRREGQSRTEGALKELEKNGMKFGVSIRSNSPEVVKECVRSGLGVGFLYYNSIKRGIDNRYFKALRFPGFDLAGRNYIVYSKEGPLSELAGQLLDFLLGSVKRIPSAAEASAPLVRRGANRRSGAPKLDSGFRAKPGF
jgi:DNA-binding transcriptional LysR family regulator